MRGVTIECLRCGRPRQVSGSLDHAMESGACPRCGYVGWAYSDELCEADRRELRELPVELRAHRLPPGLVAFR